MKTKLLVLILGLLCLTGCSDKPVTRSNLALDTVVTLTLYKNGSEEILDQCYNIINHYDQQLDAFDQESLIRQFGENPTTVDEDIFSLLETNLFYSNQTDGLFSPTIGRLIELWDINEPEVKEPPDSVSINSALDHINTQNLILNNNSVKLLDPEIIVNLGASSKGFIADKIKAYLLEKGVTSALINLGGNVLLVGDKEGKDFVVGIDNPDKDNQTVLGTVTLKDKSIVTSGNYQRYFTDSNGKVYHHILNPKTGYPEDNDLKEVVVISDSSLDGDILSTSLFLMGKDKAIDFVNKNYKDKISIILVTKDNQIFISSELEGNFKLGNEFENIYRVELIP